ncbi:E3 ubiquitin-protein ligase ZNF598, partial [Agrilus planipennis]|uniref:RING-type E3 ubiquitin transferase n=1 Tax=Agrilus planipennis TaxID=224129 RepID=A0A1W4XG60_AGRPL
MSYKKNLNSSETDQNQDQTCVVCFKNVDIYSIGICDHPVCYECSTRMRVLCRQNECPICRGDMPKVIFSRNIEPFAVLEEKSRHVNMKDAKFGFYFLSPSIQRAYYRLLEHECFICRKYRNSGFRTFQQLKEHMRKEHELFYCDLCVENLKIFTWERKCYTRGELGTHRRKGDVDNTSHRGHPLCEFCDTRFMDNDDLFRHLRRDHYYCHFCDADCKHHYYNSYNDLRKHYLEEHYLCEEGDCKYEQFTSVFRTDIDLKAHITSAHGKSLSKAATKQARTLELEFTLAPRSRPGGEFNLTPRSRPGGGIKGRRRGDCYNQDEEGAVGYSKYNVEPGGTDNLDNRTEDIFVNPLNAENFPSLSGESGTSTNTRTVSNVTITSKKLNPFSEENFPSLGGSSSVPARPSAVTITTTSNKFNPNNASDFPSLGSAASSRQPPGVTITRTVKQPGTSRNLSDFPSLSETAGPSSASTVRLSVNSNQDRPQSAKTSNVSIHVNHKANGVITTRISQTPTSSISVSSKTSSNDFPALSKASVPVPLWVSQKPKKQQEAKASKVAPAPTLPPNSLNDFPILNKSDKGRKTASVTMPISNTWVNLNNYNNQVKSNKTNNKNSSTEGDGSNEVPESEMKQQKSEKKSGNKSSNKNNGRSSSSKSIILKSSNINSK